MIKKFEIAVSLCNSIELSSMASFFKFKFLPTRCAAAQPPTLSPTTSPLLHLRRRKITLLTLLTRTSARRSPRRRALPENKPSSRSNTLNHLFRSSPPRDGTVAAAEVSKEVDRPVRPADFNPGSPRPGWTGFRYKSLLRKTWRPVLAGIPE